MIVDWSANNKPVTGENSIWIADLGATETPPTLVNPSTRELAYAELVTSLTAYVAAGKRVLVGFDFPYGYPAGLASALALKGRPWSAVWRVLESQITDSAANIGNRFDVAGAINAELGPGGPFWGNPVHGGVPPATKPAFPFMAQNGVALGYSRETELRLSANQKRVQSAWQLWGAGSVGSQTLMGIPRLSALRHHPVLAEVSQVWPFETGFTPDPTFGRAPIVIHAEVWPGITPVGSSPGTVKDAAQVRSLAEHFRALDRQDDLGALFASPALPLAISVVEEEGWILGT